MQADHRAGEEGGGGGSSEVVVEVEAQEGVEGLAEVVIGRRAVSYTPLTLPTVYCG